MQPNYTPACLTARLANITERWYARLWGYVTKTETCWLWTGPIDEFGYGRIHFAPGRPRAHRVVYEMAFGSIADGLVVMHRCDIPACVRPDHLTTGTIAANNLDRDAKGRGKIGLQGEANPKAKLTADQVRAIRATWTGAWGQASALMREYGIKAPALYAIVRRTSWKHVE